jgi:hypothetical protein
VIRREEIDADNFFSACNGVIDLRTGGDATDKGYFITKSCGGLRWTATAPGWLAFLDEIFEGRTDLTNYINARWATH